MTTLHLRIVQAGTVLATLFVCLLIIPVTGTPDVPVPAGVYVGFAAEALTIVGLLEWGHRSERI